MRCGVLCDNNGNIQRRWMLVSDTVTYDPIDAGDEVVEWDTDHGANEPHPVRHVEIIERVEVERQQIQQFRIKDDALQHNWERARLVKRRQKGGG